MDNILEGILEPTGKIKLESGKLPVSPVRVRVTILEEILTDELMEAIKEQDKIRERLSKRLSGKSSVEIIREWRDKRCK